MQEAKTIENEAIDKGSLLYFHPTTEELDSHT